MFRRFPSIQFPARFGYAYDSDQWSSEAQVNPRFRMFETYGDGLTQHSGDWAITIEYMGDYLASLATLMLNDAELLNRCSHELDCGPSVDVIQFAASVVWKESDNLWEKRRYYSISERKISASRSKEHDKRYEEIKDWANGSPEAVYRMIVPEYADALRMYANAEAIRTWFQAQPDYGRNQHYMPLAAEFLKWFKDDDNRRDKAQDLRHAYGACLCLIRAHRLRAEAEINLANMPKPQAPADETAAVEAETTA